MGKDRLRMVDWVIPPGEATSDQLIFQGNPHEQNSPKLGCVSRRIGFRIWKMIFAWIVFVYNKSMFVYVYMYMGVS
jgi:hypothetical protein